MATATPSRTAADLAERCARSAAVTEAGSWLRTAEVPGWMAERHASHRFAVRRIPFAALTGWSFAPGTGNLRHDSGRFFTVEGLQVSVGTRPFPHWQQPIIKQPEVGILGILAKEFDGVLHFLMQAKMEPGNRNLLQLSPTVQATRSNYTKVHRGAEVRYLDHFLRPAPGSVVADVLQSEHGSWFLRKSNRNMIVETRDEVPVADDFCWLTLGQIGRLLRRDNVVNMDARSVLACVPTGDARRSGAPYGDTDLLSWFTAERSRHTVGAERIPLDAVAGWRRGPDTIERPDGRYFRVVAVAVEAGSREVTGWSQPLIEPCGLGVTAFLTRRVRGVPQVLVHARVEGGFLDTVELGPTVQCVPGNHAALPPGDRPPFLDTVLTAGPGRIRYAAVHSEEGGRFLHAESRYLLVEAADDMPKELPPGYRWVTPGMLGALVRHGHYLNVQARSLLSLLTTGAAGLQD
ncbi:NDP-hexose 2,3-dehydratase family protein [Streptomyces decoyicus]|uniref:NDP-hexose 2,3-dehydratase family protein n=1 Tax=Streptomyces decoyicus TaxID=249567 RepID=A0ABZ1FB19_9ACTN|nr:NDP-hexose 2,3-dehydratase family protein [Streptomyces decoyicus]WSB67475.1 NDP-hexose 2,3-dehydratase family protein [Streptomyces decoyicus]